MAGAAVFGGVSYTHPHHLFLDLVRQIVEMSRAGAQSTVFKKDCADLVRRVSLLTHFLEEIKDSVEVNDMSSGNNWSSDLVWSLQAAKRLLLTASTFHPINNADESAKRIAFQFQCVTWKLEKALSNIPYDQFDISEEVQEQVALVRSQLQRATERYGVKTSRMISFALARPAEKAVDKGRRASKGDQEVGEEIKSVSGSNESDVCIGDNIVGELDGVYGRGNDGFGRKSVDGGKKPDMILIPDDFLCPISLEIMRDPVTVATGQTYERSYIQRWIDSGNATCPKTQQKLEHFMLTPNYVLRKLISQWCVKHNIEQPTLLATGWIKKSDGSFCDVSGDIAIIQALVRKLSSRTIEERRAAVSEIRSLSKRSTDNRILIAEAGAIPVLLNLLTSDDVSIQENAVTAILNLSIYENNRGLIMLAGAIPSIVQVLRAGSIEARENAAATLFSLSLADENRIIIGASGAIPALVELLENGSARGKKDAATALFNLCIYQGNKGRAVRAGIITALLKMLTESRTRMIDEALTILSVLANNQEAKVAIVKANTIPVLIDLLRMGMPRSKENAAAILLSLCKRDVENLACISRLGGIILLTEIAKSGTERAKRKATLLLEHLKKLQQA